MDLLSRNTVLVFAFSIGIIAGFTVRRAKLCTFGAIETLLLGGDARRVKALAAGLGIAIAVTGAWFGTFMLIGGWCAMRRWLRARLWGVQRH